MRHTFLALLALSLIACEMAPGTLASSSSQGKPFVQVDFQLPDPGRGLGSDASVASVEVVARSAGGSLLGSSLLTKQGNGSWKGQINLTGTGMLTFSAHALDVTGISLYGGRVAQTVSSVSGQSVTIPTFSETVLIGSGRGASEQLGEAVASDGTWLFAGGGAVSSMRGQVVVFRKAGARWSRHSTIAPADLAVASYFGRALALSGTTLFVGSSAYTSGNILSAVYVFDYDLNTDSWTQTARLTSPNPTLPESFGHALVVSSDGSTLIVGAPGGKNGGSIASGTVYVYSKGAGWSDGSGNRQATLTDSAGTANERFGWSLAASADGALLLVGAIGVKVSTYTNSGTCFVFEKPTLWGDATESGKIVPSDPAAGGYFGYSAAVSGTTLFVGAQGKSAAYVYSYSTSTHSGTQSAKLTLPGGYGSGSELGTALAVSSDGSQLLVGADTLDFPDAPNTQPGGVVRYAKGSNWASGSGNFAVAYRAPSWGAFEWGGSSVCWAGSQVATGILGLDTASGSKTGGVAIFE